MCNSYFSLSVTANAEIGDSPKSKLRTGRRCVLVSYSRTWWYPVPTAILDCDPWPGRKPNSVTQIGTWRSRKSLGTWREDKKIIETIKIYYWFSRARVIILCMSHFKTVRRRWWLIPKISWELLKSFDIIRTSENISDTSLPKIATQCLHYTNYLHVFLIKSEICKNCPHNLGTFCKFLKTLRC